MFFNNIIGQDYIKEKLADNVKNNRISHAQLFYEQEGYGALGMAFAYARYLNCEAPKENESCGTCFSCLKYNKLAHPDLHIFFPVAPGKDGKKVTSKTYINHFREAALESPYISISKWYKKIGIEKKQAIINADDCNEIVKLSLLKPYESKYKVFVIWIAEKLQYRAAPKLLKTIEEPPENNVFVFITYNPYHLPETINSRLQTIKFPPIKSEEIANTLSEKYECNKETAEKIASQSSGSFTQALNLHKLSEPDEFFFLLRDWLRSCYKLDPKEIFSAVNSISEFGREKQKHFLNYGLKIINESLRINYGEYTPIKMFEEELAFLNKFSKTINNKNIIQITKNFEESIKHIERNANSKIILADLSFKMYKLFNLK